MTHDGNRVLERIRQAVAEGNRLAAVSPLPARGDVGYQGGGGDLPERFCEQLALAGGTAHRLSNIAVAAARVLELVQVKSAQHILLGRGQILDSLSLAKSLRERGLTVNFVDEIETGAIREAFFRADIGISGVAYAIAETGSLVMASRLHDPRSLSLLPPVHIAVVAQNQIVPDLFDLFTELEPDKSNLPACLSLITGPSKTGDIELKLVTGVHGPGEVHVILIES